MKSMYAVEKNTRTYIGTVYNATGLYRIEKLENTTQTDKQKLIEKKFTCSQS